jgi:hypothetical protein
VYAPAVPLPSVNEAETKKKVEPLAWDKLKKLERKKKSCDPA